MRKVIAICVFFFGVIFCHILGCQFFPIDETTNTLIVPDWYVFAIILIPLFVACVIGKSGPKKEKIFYTTKSANINNDRKAAEEALLSELSYFIFNEFEPDVLFMLAADTVIETGQASASILQRRLNLSFSRSAHLIDQLEKCKIVSSQQGSSPRKILVSTETWNHIKPDVQEIVDKRIRRLEEATALSTSANKSSESFGNPQIGISPIECELTKIDAMDGHNFEYWCADLLKKVGFENVSVTQGSGDQGVDVLAEKDGIKYAIQCKCYSSNLGNTPVQEVNTGKTIYQCHIGAVMTNQHFTSGAKQAAEATGVLLWDRERIIKMLNEAKS